MVPMELKDRLHGLVCIDTVDFIRDLGYLMTIYGM